MKRYRFRLAAVLRVRRLEEERAAADLATAHAAVVTAAGELARRRQHYAAIDTPAGTVDHERYEAHRVHKATAAAAVGHALARHAAAVTHADECRAQWSIAAQRVRALERLDERRRAEHLHEVLQEEAKTLDDIAASRRVSARA